MKPSVFSLVTGTCALLIAGAFGADAQVYQFKFKGTVTETNATGLLKSRPIDEKGLLQEVAAKTGITDISGMMLVYHVMGHDLGDTIEVVDSHTGARLDDFIGLYFGQSLGRVGVTNSAATEERRIDYVYTDQNSHSMGAALVSKRYLLTGGMTRPIITGRMDWVRTAEGSRGNRIYSGTFRALGKLTFPR